MCKECNIKFIGPDYEVIELMGDKARAREIMKKSNIPVVPGYEGEINSYTDALEIANNIGFPVMLRFRKRHRYENIDDLEVPYIMEEDRLILEEIMTLSTKYKEVLILYYSEGYKISEIAEMIQSSQSTVKKRLERGRNLLKNNLKEQLL